MNFSFCCILGMIPKKHDTVETTIVKYKFILMDYIRLCSLNLICLHLCISKSFYTNTVSVPNEFCKQKISSPQSWKGKKPVNIKNIPSSGYT